MAEVQDLFELWFEVTDCKQKWKFSSKCSCVEGLAGMLISHQLHIAESAMFKKGGYVVMHRFGCNPWLKACLVVSTCRFAWVLSVVVYWQ